MSRTTSALTRKALGNASPGRFAARLIGVRKSHRAPGGPAVEALRGVDLAVPTGTMVAVIGPSGAGKSTLLHCASGLTPADSGGIHIGETSLTTLNERALTRLRRDRIGLLLPGFDLVPALTVRENITLPIDLAGRGRVDAVWSNRVITAFGPANRLDRRPRELTPGERRRAACARALIGRPEILIADEPTAGLDTRAADEVLALLRLAVSDMGRTVLTATRDPYVASRADIVVFLGDGRVLDRLSAPDQHEVLLRMRRSESAAPARHRRAER
ncbi:ATP-binding cassette domain-containing protein [Nocardiopsis sp. N85]|uniref:ABC transporter ATP-binding protein n=1 Tax=Nocardiopsis sp. N85 TaxID=3029400 RepID=UPI00237FBD67|nr:ATP-binding cassette domain-containing protein [Nocardiopsis sp. N85]MDE3722860.1 ATP-binding cassette domain-containing protein [Nocardiopsis sp. N85]